MIWVTACILGPLAIGVITYLNVCWMFGLALVADKGLRFWPALELSRRVVSKHWWMTFWLLAVSGVLAILGVIACCSACWSPARSPLMVTAITRSCSVI